MILRRSALLPCDRMDVVEPDESLTSGAMQGQRIVKTMRLVRRCRHTCHDEPDPMPARRVHHEHLPIKLEEQIQARIRRQGIMLSRSDNFVEDMPPAFSDSGQPSGALRQTTSTLTTAPAAPASRRSRVSSGASSASANAT